jgi:uncharacterized protein YdaU (DUF1376 family)
MPVRKMARPLHPGARVSLAYFPFYPSRFEAKTAHLTLEEDGCYNRLLRLCWLTPGCSLPDDRAWLMRRLRVDAETYDRVVAVVVAEFFKRRRGRIYSPRLSAIFEETSAAHNRRVKAGQKGGRPRKSLENNETGQSNAKAMPKQPEPEPEPYTLTTVSVLDVPINLALDAYNQAAKRCGWPEVQKLTKPRISALNARIKDVGGIDGWRSAIDRAEASDFLCGRTDTGRGPFFASFDFLTKPANFTKLMEGTYDNRNRLSGTPRGPSNRADAALANIARIAGLSQASGDDWG